MFVLLVAGGPVCICSDAFGPGFRGQPGPEGYLRDKLETEVRIGKFRSDFRNAINFDDVYLEDQKGDTLVSVGHLGVNIDICAR